MKPHILSYSLPALKAVLTDVCERPFQVKQILRWIFVQHIVDFQQMTNISLVLRDKLSEQFDTAQPHIVRVVQSSDGSTKFLLELVDGNKIEMVYMPSEKKNTLCLSVQVGCSRGCTFCATGGLGLVRDLSLAEILWQIFIAFGYFPEQRLTNIVFMGMGEPLDNMENLLAAIDVVQHEEGLCFSGRRITVSTCGVIPKIYELLERKVKVKLAVSLNSAIDEKRTQLMPINKLYPLAELKRAILTYRKHSVFRVTFEYIMIANFNMGNDDVKALAKFCGDISCKINLIGWNEIGGSQWQSPTERQIEDFVNRLRQLPVAITLRTSRGADIAGACGQLVGRV